MLLSTAVIKIYDANNITHECRCLLDNGSTNNLITKELCDKLKLKLRPPEKWKPFVANRVSEIQTVEFNYEWRHVLSGDNPADLFSRGVLRRQLATSN